MDITQYQQYQIANTGGAPAKIFDTPSTDGKVLEKMIEGNVVGRATGRTFSNDYYEDLTPIVWVEFEEDPYGWPPKRYVPSLYLKPYGSVVLPEVTVTPEKQETTTTETDKAPVTTTITTVTPLKDTTDTPAPKTSNYLVIGGIVLSLVVLIVALVKGRR